jgi:hypothetical protein
VAASLNPRSRDADGPTVTDEPDSLPDLTRAVVLYALARTRWERENGPVLLVAERRWQ